jgi:hypothetical protein
MYIQSIYLLYTHSVMAGAGTDVAMEWINVSELSNPFPEISDYKSITNPFWAEELGFWSAAAV